ncbi:MAG: hypothetical protein ACRD0W_25905 [Acidimicrobiales bacterium]
MTLYHYTCDHGAARIGDSGILQPHLGLVWLTDLDVPMREALGLTSHILNCDRIVHRYRVTDTASCQRWLTYLGRRWQLDLELADGARPAHWWVSEQPVPVVYDPKPVFVEAVP